jgi:hypothetical protein
LKSILDRRRGEGIPEPVTVDRLQAQPHPGGEASLLSVRLDSPATPVVPEIKLPTTSIYGRERSFICRREISTLKFRRTDLSAYSLIWKA